MEVIRLGLARVPPRSEQPPIGVEAMDTRVAVAVGHVEIA